jgi:hypothetical protein
MTAGCFILHGTESDDLEGLSNICLVSIEIVCGF